MSGLHSCFFVLNAPQGHSCPFVESFLFSCGPRIYTNTHRHSTHSKKAVSCPHATAHRVSTSLAGRRGYDRRRPHPRAQQALGGLHLLPPLTRNTNEPPH